MSDDKKLPLVFEIGQKVEKTQEAFEHEMLELTAMKNAFAMSVKCLEDYRAVMIKEQLDAKLPIKEVEFGKLYVNRCIDLISNLCLSSQQKLLRAEGAVEALKKTVLTIKEIYDTELSKEKIVKTSKKKEIK